MEGIDREKEKRERERVRRNEARERGEADKRVERVRKGGREGTSRRARHGYIVRLRLS